MNQIYSILIGILILILGFPIGILLSKLTQEEKKEGQFWFKLIIIFCFIGAVISLIIKNDALFFSFLFFAIVTSKSLKTKEKK